MTEQFANLAITTLNGGIDDNPSTTSVVVTDATGFPGSGNFRIVVDTELMLVTGVSGSTFTVTRAIESTAIASHSSGAPVAQVLTAASLSLAAQQAIATEAATDLLLLNPRGSDPGSPSDGMMWYDDSNDELRVRINGTTYKLIVAVV